MPTETGYDAVVVGAGINGLVAAAELAPAGWRVALVEAGGRLGGFIDSRVDEEGFTHDTFSSWHPQFVGGAAYPLLGAHLARHGLEYRTGGDLLTASVADDGRTTVAYRDPERTAAAFTEPGDRDRYRAMVARTFRALCMAHPEAWADWRWEPAWCMPRLTQPSPAATPGAPTG
ncbi:FAD-dependent oxidoreductase [Streptomyces carpinensis]|uniref:FAD-dependent oxidoreductase n=1 Tax=Streptomyces carpinensis TaxID=66369 RepID=UPI000A37A70E|nr:FAD-dependent oxidoreductase [Streptomyces carpinensis]